MIKAFVLLSLTKLAISSGADGNMEVKRNAEGKMVQQMKIEAPSLTEEDQYGYVMPDQYRCDSCKAVVFHLNQALEKRQMKSRRMHDWEYLELFEDTCKDAFEGYGVKLIDGKNTLSGPGLKQPDSPAPGGAFIQMGGQGWTNRLSELCRSIVYDKVGEDELYEKFYSDRKIPESMCYNEMGQCSSLKSGKAKVTNKKTKASSKAAPAKSKDLPRTAAAPAKSKDSQRVEVKSDGSSTLEKAFPTVSENKTGQEEVSATDFLQSLAVQDGLDIHAYSAKKTRQEWEKLIVGMAGKIYSRQV